jgi:hypothetical protein
MSVDSMTITHSKQISILHHKILNDDIGILIDLILLIYCHALPVTKGILRDEVQRGCIFILGVLCQQLPPFQRRHLDIFLRFRLGMFGFSRLALLSVQFLLNLILMLPQGTDGLLMQLFFLGIRVRDVGISEEI